MERKIIEPGTKAPAFSLPDQDGKQRVLKDYLGKWVVLYFYPKDDTPGCTIEGIEFTAKNKEFEKRNAVVLGVSGDSSESHAKFCGKHSLGITLLADVDKNVLEQYGAFGHKKLYGRTFLGITRSTYLIDPQGKVAKVWKTVKAKGHAEEVLRVIDGIN